MKNDRKLIDSLIKELNFKKFNMDIDMYMSDDYASNSTSYFYNINNQKIQSVCIYNYNTFGFQYFLYINDKDSFFDNNYNTFGFQYFLYINDKDSFFDNNTKQKIWNYFYDSYRRTNQLIEELRFTLLGNTYTNPKEIYDRLLEFDVIKDNEIDFISLNQLFDFYNVEFNEDDFKIRLNKILNPIIYQNTPTVTIQESL